MGFVLGDNAHLFETVLGLANRDPRSLYLFRLSRQERCVSKR